MPELDAELREAIDFAADLADRDNYFAIRVKGDTLIDAMINDGDILVLKRTDRAKNGELVAVNLIDRNELCVKRYHVMGPSAVRLESANPVYRAINTFPENIQIFGRVVAVIRRLS